MIATGPEVRYSSFGSNEAKFWRYTFHIWALCAGNFALLHQNVGKMAPLRVTAGGLGNQNLERYALRLLPYTLPQYMQRQSTKFKSQRCIKVRVEMYSGMQRR